MTNLHRLHREHGQSPWLDNLTRDAVVSGALAHLIDDGVRGVTANPTIIAKAISGSAAYDDQLAALAGNGTAAGDALWELAITDVRDAADLLRGVHEASGGHDGFVSIELAPSLADDPDGSVAAVGQLTAAVDRPNLLVKIPATEAGVAAIRSATGAGHSINVTLIFSITRYVQVLDAYLSGLEDLVASGGDPRHVHSVASFFVSRVDTEAERRIEERLGMVPLMLHGQIAVAQAKVAYEVFRRTFSSPRWSALADRGANVQRPLWASTSTKDPNLPDTLYVDELIGPDTVTTLPEATISAFNDHGTLRRTIDHDVAGAHATLAAATAAGADLDDVGLTLEDQGVASFARSFADVVELLENRMAATIEPAAQRLSPGRTTPDS